MNNFIRHLKFLLVLEYFLVRNCFCHNFIGTANFIRRQLARVTITLMSGVDELYLNKMGQLLYLVQVIEKKYQVFSNMYMLYFLWRKPMHWLNGHDLILVQKVLLFEPWRYHQGSVARGNVCKSNPCLKSISVPPEID